MFPKKHHDSSLALMEAASPDLEKQGFFAAVILNREYSGQQESYFLKSLLFRSLLFAHN
ncbi:hypothetical protein [Flavobacterium sp. 1]|uniref:hypothetical protein n=1 Tax=Flavobacterium sp. 1 TaxID=2035200 RepID=UPI0012FE34CB|nr:hypothetical protein [Flavobacterium sp. 1]